MTVDVFGRMALTRGEADTNRAFCAEHAYATA
jgi:hypothetical protein